MKTRVLVILTTFIIIISVYEFFTINKPDLNRFRLHSVLITLFIFHLIQKGIKGKFELLFFSIEKIEPPKFLLKIANLIKDLSLIVLLMCAGISLPSILKAIANFDFNYINTLYRDYLNNYRWTIPFSIILMLSYIMVFIFSIFIYVFKCFRDIASYTYAPAIPKNREEVERIIKKMNKIGEFKS